MKSRKHQNPKKARNPKTPVITVYLMNGEKMEFFDRKTYLEDVRFAAANKLDPKRFAPEIVVLRDGKELTDGGKKIEPGVLHTVALYISRDVDFWIRALRVHGMRGDTHGAERAWAEMGQEPLNGILLRSASIGNWLPQKEFSIESLIKHGAEANAVDENGRTSLAIASEKGFARAAAQLIKHGADTSFALVYEDGMSPLKDLVEKGWEASATVRPQYTRIIQLLLESGIDINAQGPYADKY